VGDEVLFPPELAPDVPVTTNITVYVPKQLIVLVGFTFTLVEVAAKFKHGSASFIELKTMLGSVDGGKANESAVPK
jgi:hypothetical protein